jgi:hypothetical protein
MSGIGSEDEVRADVPIRLAYSFRRAAEVAEIRGKPDKAVVKMEVQVEHAKSAVLTGNEVSPLLHLISPLIVLHPHKDSRTNC